MWHTLPEAIKLTGRSRRSLYRDMDAGRVSYRLGITGRRELETAELIRVYGDLAHFEKSVTQPLAQPVTPDGTVTAAALGPLLEELRLLRAEVKELRETMLLIEHKPQKTEVNQEAKRPADTKSSAGKVTSFADLVEKFQKRAN